MKKNQTNKQKVENKSEKKYTLDQVQSLAALIAAGILGIGGQECIDNAEKLPEDLKAVLVATIMASRDCMKDSILESILAKKNLS